MARRETGALTLREESYRRITDLLNAGALKPGAVVSQRELVERTGLTLGAIRESIPRLEAEGLLIPLRQRGTMVPSIDVAFVRNAYDLRRILEMEAIRRALDTIAPAALAAWEDEHLAFLRALETDATKAVADRVQVMDWALHQALIASMGNALIDSVYRVNAIKVRMAKQALLQVTPGNAARVLNEHLAFLRALRAGDVAAAAAALEFHLDASLSQALGGAIRA